MTSEEFKKAIRIAALENDLGVMELSERAGVSYFKTSKAWNGDKTITLVDLDPILKALGLTWDLLTKDQ